MTSHAPHARRASAPARRTSPPGRALCWLAALALAARSVRGQAGRDHPRRGRSRFTVMLDWFPNADHAALYSAIAHGDFRAVGLDVQPVVPAETAEPLKLLAAGKVDMAISYEPQLLLARDEGLKLVSIGALVQRPLTSIIALPKQHVTTVANLAGKKVGTAGIPYQAAELKTALQSAGVNPAKTQEVNVGFNLVPGDALGQGGRDTGRLLELRGDPAAAAA